jgi:hypothetical protein
LLNTNLNFNLTAPFSKKGKSLHKFNWLWVDAVGLACKTIAQCYIHALREDHSPAVSLYICSSDKVNISKPCKIV